MLRLSPELSALPIVTLLMAGCGGGSGGDGGSGNDDGGGDTIAPAIVAVTPANGASAVPPASAVLVTFSELVDCDALTPAALTLAAADDTAVAGDIACDGDTVTFAPEQALPEQQAFTARVAGIRDRAGNALAEPYSWQFTTADVTAPALSSVAPADGTLDVAVDASLAIVFTETMDCSTVNAGTLMLTGDDAPVAGAVSCDGATAGFTPAQALPKETPFTARIASGVTDASGNRLAADHTWQFSTVHRAWGAAGFLEEWNAGGAEKPQIAADGAGNAIAIWHQYDGARTDVFATRYTPRGGWDTPIAVENEATHGARSPAIATDPAGNAVAVWTQFDGSVTNIWANRYSVVTGWGAPTLIETDNTDVAGAPQVACDTAGNALAVWHQYDGTRFNILTNRYTAGSGWGNAQVIDGAAGTAQFPRIAFDAQGNALAIWHQWDTTRTNIWANRYTAGVGWGTAQLVEQNDVGSASNPVIAMNAGGSAFAVWLHEDVNGASVWGSRYTAASGWTSPTLIETKSGTASLPNIAVDVAGNAVAVWQQHDGLYRVATTRYDAANGWGTTEYLATPGSAFSPVVGIDARGTTTVLWREWDGTTYNLWAARRFPGDAGWSNADPVESATTEAGEQQIAILKNGDAIAVWQQATSNFFSVSSNRLE